jgi:hypothetical protein
MIHFSVSRHYRASSEELWRFLTDTTLWPMWGPTVMAARCSERFIRKGSVGTVRTPIGVWVPFVITEYDDLHFWAWKVAGIRATGHRVAAQRDQSCRLFFELPVYGLPYALVCWRATANLARLLEATEVLTRQRAAILSPKCTTNPEKKFELKNNRT